VRFKNNENVFFYLNVFECLTKLQFNLYNRAFLRTLFLTCDLKTYIFFSFSNFKKFKKKRHFQTIFLLKFCLKLHF
jgi:hypothetical protein